MRFHRVLGGTFVRLEARIERELSRQGVLPFIVLITASALGWRWAAVAFSVPTLGPDYGHYIIAANWYLGVDRSSEGPFDPPFVPLLSVGLSPLLGMVNALKILGPAALAANFVGGVYFLSAYVKRWTALAGSAVFVQWQTFLEFITSGGVTNLFGIAFSLVFFRLFSEVLADSVEGWHPRRKEVFASASLVLIASTHHFTTLLVGATALFWVAVVVLQETESRRAKVWTASRVIIPAALANLVYLPYFLSLVTTDAQAGFGRPTSVPVFVLGIEYAWQSTPELWILFFALATLCVAVLRLSSPLAPPVAALALTPLLLEFTILSSHPVRTLFFLEFPVVFISLLWFARDRFRAFRRFGQGRIRVIGGAACAVLLAASLVVLPGSGHARQSDAIGKYHEFMSAHTFEAFDWIRAMTSPDTTFAVDAGPSPAYNDLWKGMATGWWLEGYANRRAIYEANPPLLSSLPRWAEASDANRLFAGETVFEDGILRMADGFPLDDAAVPKVYTGYYQDYHEFVGFAVPRVVNSTSGQAFTLVLGANPDYDRGLRDGRGWVSGNYSGPGLTGDRTTSFDSSEETVRLDLALSVDPALSWDAFEMTIRLPSWTQLDLTRLDQGRIDARVPESIAYEMEAGTLEFSTSNLSAPTIVPHIGSPGELGIGLRWTFLGSTVSLQAKVSLTKYPGTGPETHPATMRISQEILDDYRIDFLYVTMDSISNVQRFDRAQDRFARAYANPGVVIFRVT